MMNDCRQQVSVRFFSLMPSKGEENREGERESKISEIFSIKT